MYQVDAKKQRLQLFFFLFSESERTNKANKYLMFGGEAASLAGVTASMLFMGEIVKAVKRIAM